MSQLCYLLQCKNVISDIKKKMEDEGDEIAPLLADTFNRNENSTYKNSWAGLRTLNFKNISQRLDENGYESVHDFVKEVQSMLKGVADEFVFSVEVMLFSVKFSVCVTLIILTYLNITLIHSS